MHLPRHVPPVAVAEEGLRIDEPGLNHRHAEEQDGEEELDHALEGALWEGDTAGGGLWVGACVSGWVGGWVGGWVDAGGGWGCGWVDAGGGGGGVGWGGGWGVGVGLCRELARQSTEGAGCLVVRGLHPPHAHQLPPPPQPPTLS
jgi:hypothetical protein